MLKTLRGHNYLFDSRPEFNGEFKLYQYLLSQGLLENNLFVGAKDDFFYLQVNPQANYYLFEPDQGAADTLSDFSRSRLISCVINTIPLWSTSKSIKFYPYFTTCFCPKEASEMQEALSSGTICDPYLWQLLFTGEYTLRRNQAIQDAVDIHAYSFDWIKRSLPSSFPDSFDFIKLDVEGAEVEILQGMQTVIPNSLFIQFEYGTTWFHGGYTFMDVVEAINQESVFNFYIILNDRLLKIHPEMMQQYFFSNILATKLDFGDEQIFSQKKSRFQHHNFPSARDLTVF
jgi:hypothetical protein